jgi:hypothetical protein
LQARATKFNEGRFAPGMRAGTGAYISSAITLPVSYCGLRVRIHRRMFGRGFVCRGHYHQ